MIAMYPYAMRIGDGTSRCIICEAVVTTEQIDGAQVVTHGDGEARRAFRYPDDYQGSPHPIQDWFTELHQYEREG